ncbi:VWA domain containing CoxE-like protein [Stieleria neptunia]|uniref:VWA domain containing CoxE-like protein n=1 Tax=Stieleria neptunia TaxID=2527979 RepID=A0A518I3M5_9BACT|nr:DUF5682 family protein [Stieleria neptunia]QDV47713.1 VWA domain containing CoxE-like protein [Stieleria neptunia]
MPIDPIAACTALHQCTDPLLIGVRHHSAMLARAMPALLERFAPDVILIELPSDLSDWMPHIADPQTQAPIAISAVDPDGGMMFYPLADFSPEFAAVRWASANGVSVRACDLSVSAKSKSAESPPSDRELNATRSSQLADSVDVLSQLKRRVGASDVGDLWQRLVESPGCDADPETIRRAALTFGWAVRLDDHEPSPRDLLREAAMRQAIRDSAGKTVAIVGAFHAPVLLSDVVDASHDRDQAALAAIESDTSSVGVSLIPYSFEQLDERSGYPAGVLDPVWHQQMVQAKSNAEMEDAAAELATGVCRRLRQFGHVAGTPDAAETLRMMRDLARLRGLAVPGRGEFVESLQTCLVHGDVMGRGRAVSAAAGDVLIGDRRGVVTPNAPRCGLSVSIDQLLGQLGLPGRETAANAKPQRQRGRFQSTRSENEKELRLDVLRSPKDRARAVVLRRMVAAGIPYAQRVDTVAQGNRENLTERWRIEWQQTTAATIESVARFGVTLTQVAEEIVRRAGRRVGPDDANESSPRMILDQLGIASECGLQTLTTQALRGLDETFCQTAGISELVEAVTLMVRIAASHLPGLPLDPADAAPPIVPVFRMPDARVSTDQLLRACMQRLQGLRGSSSIDDVVCLADLIQWFSGDLHALIQKPDSQQADAAGHWRQLVTWCRQTLRDGSDRMRGAAAASLSALDAMDAGALGQLLIGWLDTAGDRDGRARLRDGLSGAVQILLSPMQNDPLWLDPLQSGLHQLSDADFLSRLPALRGAFDPFSPADRQRLLDLRLQGLEQRGSAIDHQQWAEESDGDAITRHVARLRHADLAAATAIADAFPNVDRYIRQANRHATARNDADAVDGPSSSDSKPDSANSEITLADRWRLIFGLPPESPSRTVSIAAQSLDQLFGKGRGEGSRGDFQQRRGSGGQEAPQPTTAQWADDLEALFGGDVCQEVLGQAAAAGNATAVGHLDVDSVTPSIDLLQQVLSLAGAVPESRMAKLRQLAQKITDDLARQLAVRLQTALSGLSTPRPTRRRSRRLNLSRTIRANLANGRRRSDGRPTIVADQLIFNAPARRELDWHVTFVVDVSASMSASVVYSALVAAIFDALPALSVRFLAFSTELIDLSEQVDDPLALLLEVDVGGGTDIGLGLRGARAGIKVPSRSIVVLVTDFEEGVSIPGMLGEVRALVDSGVRCIGLASLDDSGQARFHQGLAQLMASAGMSVAAVSPEKLAQWVGDQIRGNVAGGSIDG